MISQSSGLVGFHPVPMKKVAKDITMENLPGYDDILDKLRAEKFVNDDVKALVVKNMVKAWEVV